MVNSEGSTPSPHPVAISPLEKGETKMHKKFAVILTAITLVVCSCKAQQEGDNIHAFTDDIIEKIKDDIRKTYNDSANNVIVKEIVMVRESRFRLVGYVKLDKSIGSRAIQKYGMKEIIPCFSVADMETGKYFFQCGK